MALTSNDINTLTGATVLGQDDDKIGTIGQVYVDPDGSPTWATVKTGFFGSSESFIPLDEASLTDSNVHVNYTKAFVKDAPRVADDGELSEDETGTLYSYYGLGGTSTTGGADYDTTTTGYDAGTAGTGYAGADVSAPRTGTNRTTEGYDTSGPTTDDAMTRSEERLNVGTRQVETGRAKLRKYVVTEQQTVTVPVTHEEATLVREPITDANVGDATSGPSISEEEHEVVLHADQVVTSKDTVPVERVKLGTNVVTEQQQVTEDVRKEQIELVGDDGNTVTPGTTGTAGN